MRHASLNYAHCRAMAHALAAFALSLASPASAQLTYRDASTDLGSPRMEGGRTELEFGDVNGDGHPDILMIGDHGSPRVNSEQHGITVWFGDGAGRFEVFQNGDFGYGGLALGDVNGDGLMDVGYGMHHDYSNSDFGDQIQEVALGDGSGRRWTPWDDGLAGNGEDWGMFGTDFADVDGDGDLDLGSISFGCCAGVHVYLNNGDGSWTQSFGFLGGNSSQIFQFGDVSGDGRPDFAVAHGSGTIYLGDGAGGFTKDDGGLPPLQTWRAGVALGDVNDDGRDDLSLISNTRGVAVFTWDGPGRWRDISGSLPVSGDYRLTQIADMDGDGHGDIVALREAGTEVYLGDGRGGWTLGATIPAQPNTCGYSALRTGGDLDHNGLPDIAGVMEENCRPFVGGINRARLFLEDSAPRKLSIRPTSLTGGQTVRADSVRFIDWASAVPDAPAHTGTVRVELSVFGPSGPWTTLADGLPNNGRYQWHSSKRLPDTHRAHLRLTVTERQSVASVVTPDPFTITGGRPRFADFDGSGRVELIDVWKFQQCYTGSDGGPVTPACEAGDADGNGRIDLADYAAFEEELEGP